MMPFVPTEEGLWDRKHLPLDDFAVTLVKLDPRIAILTIKADGKVFDFMVDAVTISELGDTFTELSEVTLDEALERNITPKN